MADTLNIEIQQAIEKNLPTQVGNTLKKVLDDYEKLKVAYNVLESKIDDKANIIKRLEKENEDLRILVIDKEVLDDRAKSILEREKTIDIRLMKKDVDCANEKVSLMKDNFITVFRNIDIVRNKLGTIPVKETWYNSSSGGQDQSYRSETADITETESKK